MQKNIRALIYEICHGYNDRQREIALGDKGDSRRALVLAEYERINRAVDDGLAIIKQESLRVQIKRALIGQVGFNSMLEHFCGRNQFYAYKRLVLTEIAKRLYLQ